MDAAKIVSKISKEHGIIKNAISDLFYLRNNLE